MFRSDIVQLHLLSVLIFSHEEVGQSVIEEPFRIRVLFERDRPGFALLFRSFVPLVMTYEEKQSVIEDR